MQKKAQKIPFKPISKWFQSLNSAITKFYSKNKKAEIRLSTLQKKKKTEDGLDALNFTYYYLASHPEYLSNWLHPNIDSNYWL